jgi:hypothetical protein
MERVWSNGAEWGRYRLTGGLCMRKSVEGNVQGEDEAKPDEQDVPKMRPSSASYVEPGADSAAPPDVEGIYALAPHVQEQIGRRLSAAYDEVLRQPIPDRFLLLLDQLDQATTTMKERSSAQKESSATKETEIE